MGLNSRADAELGLQQVALLVPLLLLGSVALEAVRSWRRGPPLPRDAHAITLAATFLTVADSRLFREPSYMLVVAPITAALASALLVERGWRQAVTGTGPRPLAIFWKLATYGLAGLLLAATAVSTYAYAQDTGIFRPLDLAGMVGPTFTRLLASPPVDAYELRSDALRYDRAAWDAGEVDKGRLILRYLHDCTRAGDRVLVTGSTPYHVNYLVERPVAGGQLFWHHLWRTDPEREQEALDLLKTQSVPFAYSTQELVLVDFRNYPRIRAYLEQNYRILDGHDGHLLVDRRRTPTSRFGALGFPCFS